MKENDWQLLRFIFYGWSCFLWLLFPFMEFSVIGEYHTKNLATNFPPLFLCNATVKSLQSSRLFQSILLNYNY